MPYELRGLPLRLKTACVFTSLDLVILPDAESPSVINKVVSSLLSFFKSPK